MGTGPELYKSACFGRLRIAGHCQGSDVVRVLCVAAVATTIGIIFLLHRSPLVGSQVLVSAIGVGLAPLYRQRKREGFKLKSITTHRVPECDTAVARYVTRLILAGIELIGAKSASVVLSDAETCDEFDWNVPSASPAPGQIEELLERCTAGVESEWSLLACSKTGSEIRCLVLGREGNKLRRIALKDGFLASWNGASKTVLLSNFEFGSRWSGRIAFCDPPLPNGDKAALRELLRIVRLVTSSYQTQQRRLPGAERDERNEIARDLHDGVTQSLIAAEMHVDALRRRGVVAGIPAAAEEILVQTQELLRREVRKLRMQIEGLRSTSNSLMVCEQLADVIQSFESETGIRTNFICDSKRADISAQSAHDLVHIVQEALSNIRKHSGATKVEIRLSVDRQIDLSIQDDGRGFDFSGRRSLADLEISGKGPRVIRERVRLSGGSILIESRPSWGARLELTLPLRARGGSSDHPSRHNVPAKIGVRDAAGKQFNVA